MVDTRRDMARKWLVKELRRALRNLYDPDELRRSPLAEILCRDKPERPSALRKALISAIEALEPDPSLSTQSDAWRTHQILSARYVQQFRQKEVAEGLGLSLRQMRRQESLALRVLAEYLCAQYDLQPADSGGQGTGSSSGREMPLAPPAELTREDELAWLERSLPAEPVVLAQMVDGLTTTVKPLARALEVEVRCDMPGDLQVVVQRSTLRQALLNVLTAAIRRVPAGSVDVAVAPHDDTVRITIHPSAAVYADREVAEEQAESLEMARQLIGLSGGSLVVAENAGTRPWAVFTLPAAEQAVVLVIDDNADALQLFQRYLAGSRYGFAGAKDPEQAIVMAERLAPCAILLDIMLPNVDGWEVLGRLREHPRTAGVPVIVCTILPQERLAQALGAAGFLRKPISRLDLLAALDRHSGLRSPVSRS